jgi:hypothetical protein
MEMLFFSPIFKRRSYSRAVFDADEFTGEYSIRKTP